jgi:hypothetical protein
MDEGRYARQDASSVEIGVAELRELVGKLRGLREEKEMMRRELRLFKGELRKGDAGNAVLKALGPA